MLTFNSENTCSLFVKKYGKKELNWDGSYIGSIENAANKVSTVVKVDMYYCYSGFYFVLERYTDLQMNIESLKDIFDIPRRKYHLCKYKDKSYFMYLCDPNNECPGRFFHNKKYTYKFLDRLILVFYWLVGVNGKIWLYKDEDDKISITSHGPYLIKNEFSDLMERRIFPNKEVKDELYNFFSREEKLERFSTEFSTKNRHWYLAIISRLSSLEP
jgi:hypothetical protein